MSGVNPHPIYSQDATVFIETGDQKLEVMQAAMKNAAFLKNVQSVFIESGKKRSEFQIAIKPNIMTASIYEDPSPVYTDPELVEFLVAKLRGKGFENIAVVESRNVYDYAYQGRSVRAVAEMVGFSEEGYRIEDLTERKEPYDYGGVLGQHFVGRTWRDADYRISFAKNKTHWRCFYTGCLKNVYGCLPEWDKMKHYHGRGREVNQCCIQILDAFPVHFGFLDAWVSGDGFSGHVRDATPNHTKSIFASENVFALDWVMGEKMGVDPILNYVIQEAVRYWGTINIQREGDMTPWKPWKNVRSYVGAVLDVSEEAYWLSRFLSRALASEQDKRFPPVSRWQWFFGILQGMTRLFESLFVSKN